MSVNADIAELVGGPSQGPTVSMNPQQIADLEAHVARGQKSKYGGTATMDDVTALHAGVTVSWLAQAFRMDPKTVKFRLAKCPVLKAHQRGYIYEFKVAVAYLIPPQVDIAEYLQTVKIKDLPTRIQAEYWQAMRARQIWEREAGNLWRTEDVLAKFGEVFGILKSTTQLWGEDMERSVILSIEQRDFLRERIDSLLDDLYGKLTTLPEQSATASSLAEHIDDERPQFEDDAVADLV